MSRERTEESGEMLRQVFTLQRRLLESRGATGITAATAMLAFAAEITMAARGPITTPARFAVTIQQVMAAGFYHPEWLAAWVLSFDQEQMKGLADEMVHNMPFVPESTFEAAS